MSHFQQPLVETFQIVFWLSLFFPLTIQWENWGWHNSWRYNTTPKDMEDICGNLYGHQWNNSNGYSLKRNNHPNDSEFCSHCSNGRDQHTMCKYTNETGSSCQPHVGPSGVTEEEKREIVQLHNDLRRKVATGNETRGNPGPQPPAANMKQMYWDDDLARVAQRWADQCTVGHDTCRDDTRGITGQNVYMRMMYPEHETNWTHAIMQWYDEVSLFNKSVVGSYRFDYKTGHYTQVVWADTYLLGCGRRDFGKDSTQKEKPDQYFKKYYVCNYYPAGNWDQEPIYIQGNPCTNCSSATWCNHSLCDCGPMPPGHTTPVMYTTKGSPELSVNHSYDSQEYQQIEYGNSSPSFSWSTWSTWKGDETETWTRTTVATTTTTTTTTTTEPSSTSTENTTDYSDYTDTTTESIYRILYRYWAFYPGFVYYYIFY